MGAAIQAAAAALETVDQSRAAERHVLMLSGEGGHKRRESVQS